MTYLSQNLPDNDDAFEGMQGDHSENPVINITGATPLVKVRRHQMACEGCYGEEGDNRQYDCDGHDSLPFGWRTPRTCRSQRWRVSTLTHTTICVNVGYTRVNAYQVRDKGLLVNIYHRKVRSAVL